MIAVGQLWRARDTGWVWRVTAVDAETVDYVRTDEVDPEVPWTCTRRPHAHLTDYMDLVVPDERSDVERWLAGECERPSDEAIKHALGLFVGIAMQGMNGTARLAMAAERRLNEADTRWSLNPWVLGYQAGEAATDQRYQQALSHVANSLRMKAGG